MKIILAIIISLFISKSANSQSKSLINMSNGDINISDENCCLKYYGTFPVFGDIAFGNDRIYALDNRLNIIDFYSKQIINSFFLYDSNGNQITSNGLEIVNDSLLFFESNAMLYSFNLQTSISQFMGNIGYYCSGDLLFVDSKLYMTTTSGELITINLDSSYDVVNVSIVESSSISINSAFGISKKMNSNEILIYNSSTLYEFDTILKEYSKVCDLDGMVNGATFYKESFIFENNFPNIITPNNDNINDFIDLSDFSKFSIVNRWGDEVINDSNTKIWRGENKNGDPLSEGVYFIMVHFEDCGQEKYVSKPITVIK